MSRHILNTGQTECFDRQGAPLPCRGSGQDAAFTPGIPWPQPRFRVQGETVLDLLTGLVWTRSANPHGFPLSHAEAQAFIAALNASAHLGFSDWRLPGRRELLSLISFAQANPALPAAHPFRQVTPNWCWTSTPAAISPGSFWYLHLAGGRLFFGHPDEYHLVWPLRSSSPVLPPPPPAPRFLPWHGDAVQDQLTGLLWSLSADLGPGPVPWPRALAIPHAANHRLLAGRTDWRLPTILELESLVDTTAHTPALPPGHPFASPGDTYWSSTNSAFDPAWSMCLYLHKGAIGVAHKPTAACLAWIVADPGAA